MASVTIDNEVYNLVSGLSIYDVNDIRNDTFLGVCIVITSAIGQNIVRYIDKSKIRLEIDGSVGYKTLINGVWCTVEGVVDRLNCEGNVSFLDAIANLYSHKGVLLNASRTVATTYEESKKRVCGSDRSKVIRVKGDLNELSCKSSKTFMEVVIRGRVRNLAYNAGMTRSELLLKKIVYTAICHGVVNITHRYKNIKPRIIDFELDRITGEVGELASKSRFKSANIYEGMNIDNEGVKQGTDSVYKEVKEEKEADTKQKGNNGVKKKGTGSNKTKKSKKKRR